ncbi:hypothetical protein GKR62_13375, partial [Yersinia pseudotuberculosis]|nr:hypothetical protein [Yersinia pseudotuberculosis]
AYMDVFTASLRSACSLRRGHFVNNLRAPKRPESCFNHVTLRNNVTPRASSSA